ncbi:hypothetical protein FKM82_024386 [Ascaphus truei]
MVSCLSLAQGQQSVSLSLSLLRVSGLSPFLGDNDTETLNNVLNGDKDFDEETFETVSEEAKDFISSLLVRDKSLNQTSCDTLNLNPGTP